MTRKASGKNTKHSSRETETDYRTLRLGRKQLLAGTACGLLISAFAAFLFYRSPAGMLLAVLFVPLYLARKKREYIRARSRRLARQFQSGMQMASGALAAGYSVENAWRSAQTEVGRLYGAESEFYLELARMNQKVRMNEPLDRIFSDFARRSGIEDIVSFAEVFCYARKSGGNLAAIMQKTVRRMQEKEDVLAEIENAVAAKRMEQKVMNLMLPGILLFLTAGSPEYASCLYGTIPGAAVMSVCLAGYLFAVFWSEKLVDIRV